MVFTFCAFKNTDTAQETTNVEQAVMPLYGARQNLRICLFPGNGLLNVIGTFVFGGWD